MILVDTHVHIHPRFRIGEFLDAATLNFEAAAARTGIGGAFCGVLCLTESAGRDCFNDLQALKTPEAIAQPGDWTFRVCPDGLVLHAGNRNGRELWLVAGRQIVSHDDLEVLALLTTGMFADGALPLEKLVEEVLGTGALAVVPWGAGKWWGRRGRVVADLVDKGPRSGFFLGDNGGRPGFLAARAHFDLAARKGVRILSGSDTLPFQTETGRPGRNGVVLPGALDTASPAASLKEKLTDPAAGLTAYGERETLLRFVRNQVAMQWVKRFNGRPS